MEDYKITNNLVEEIEDSWDTRSLRARVQNFKLRKRYEAGSPNAVEISAYAGALPPKPYRDTAIMLGMTPELRCLATKLFKKVISVDRNQEAIKLYTDWVPQKYRKKEIIIQDDWFSLPKYISKPVSVILGDGVFANLPDLENQRELLKCIASLLALNGNFITRKVMIPNGFNPEENNITSLINLFRRKALDEAEFGFGIRFLGHYRCCYEPNTFILDNKKLFEECRNDILQGKLTNEEYSYICRYYFSGRNCIIPEDIWERTLEECGFNFKIQQCHGKHWYSYYKIYNCTLTHGYSY